MKNKTLIFFLAALGSLALFSCDDKLDFDYPRGKEPLVDTRLKPIAKTNTDTKVWAHFMLWYETPESATDGNWGAHWKKTENDPVFEDGEWKNLYTYFPPITGPYASNDPVILEYQLLLMKYSGIDGIIADWYGITDKGTKEDKTRALEALYKMCEQTGIELAICYEDRFKTGTDAACIASIKADIDYLQANFFTKPVYSKIDNQPLLLIFGPKVEGTNGLTATGALWSQCFAGTEPKPAFYPLEGKQGTLKSDGVSKGTFNWSNNSSGNDDYYLNQFSALALQVGRIFIAMPGFKDCYNGVGAAPQYRVTPHNGGAFFKQLLDLVKEKQPQYLQLCTWNDYGEGTVIEPTAPNAEQNGGNPYIFLEQLHGFTGVTSANKEVLPQIKRFYDLRLANKNNQENIKLLDMAFLYFRSVQPDRAIAILNRLDPQN